jgi:O-antigen ligase
MVRDFPVFGTGPGTFDPLFQMYRISPEEYWPVQLHNDWLETRVTFGWLGSGLIAAAFLIAVGRWFLPGGIHGGRRFTMLLWLALLGCMVHARFDFPFQIYSIVFLFVMLCAILFSVSRRGETAR